MTNSPKEQKQAIKPRPAAPVHPDLKVLAIFAVALVLALSVVTAIWRLWVQGAGAGEVIMVYLGAFTFPFFPAGIAAFRYQRSAGKVRTRRVLRWFAVLALVLDLILLIVIYMMYEMGWGPAAADPGAASPFASPAAVAVMTVALFVVLFLILVVFLIIGFGIIWLMVALERRLAPWALERVRRISRFTSDETRNGDFGRFAKYSALRWLFNIPEVLETDRLLLSPRRPSERFPRLAFRSAMGWSALFGTVIAIDISFNPFLRESLSLQQLFSITSVASLFIPWLVLPWFIFRRLGAGIRGQRRIFLLYDGLRSRVFGTLVAVGTLYTVVRLALRDVPLSTILYSFFNYYIGFLSLVTIFTFVYFNYFEADLAADVSGAYQRLRGNEEIRGGDEEE